MFKSTRSALSKHIFNDFNNFLNYRRQSKQSFKLNNHVFNIRHLQKKAEAEHQRCNTKEQCFRENIERRFRKKKKQRHREK